jgi:hypothetical protein
MTSTDTNRFHITHRYDFECYDKHGNLKWTDSFENQNITEGMKQVLSDAYAAGTAAALYVGLVDDTGYTAYAAADTAAKITDTANPPTTNGWQECTSYDEATRPALTMGTPTGTTTITISNSASKAAFTISATKTIRGAFIVTANTKAGTTGKLYGIGDFSASKNLVDDDVLQVTVTVTLA